MAPLRKKSARSAPARQPRAARVGSPKAKSSVVTAVPPDVPPKPMCFVAMPFGRKAPPGKSNHSNGIAVDFTATVDGKDIPNEYNNQGPWRKGAGKATFEWLRDNAHSFGFKNLSTEAWHYDWKK